MEEKGKKLGLWNIIGLGLGGAIGTGVFVLLGRPLHFSGCYHRLLLHAAGLLV